MQWQISTYAMSLPNTPTNCFKLPLRALEAATAVIVAVSSCIASASPVGFIALPENAIATHVKIIYNTKSIDKKL